MKTLTLQWAATALGVVASLVVLTFLTGYHTVHETECLVTDKDRTSHADGGSVHRLYADCGEFEVRDTLVHRKFSSSNTYGSIEPGQVYELRHYGWRVPFLSMFPNVIEAKEIRQ